jgi:hypothetical protein
VADVDRPTLGKTSPFNEISKDGRSRLVLAGGNMVLNADVIVAARSARFATRPPGCGRAQPWLVARPPRTAKRYLFTATRSRPRRPPPGHGAEVVDYTRRHAGVAWPHAWPGCSTS